jgi:hypothetical protein
LRFGDGARENITTRRGFIELGNDPARLGRRWVVATEDGDGTVRDRHQRCRSGTDTGTQRVKLTERPTQIVAADREASSRTCTARPRRISTLIFTGASVDSTAMMASRMVISAAANRRAVSCGSCPATPSGSSA